MDKRNAFIIRLSLVLGPLFFAALTYWMRTTGEIPDATGPVAGQSAVLAFAVAAVGWALFVRSNLGKKPEAQRYAGLLIGWAPGEGCALLGVVTHFTGGPVMPMAIGLLAFALVLILLPISAAQG